MTRGVWSFGRWVCTSLMAGVAVGVWSVPAPAQEEKKDADKPQGRPRIEVEPKSLNLGEVFVGGKGAGEIKIKNTGDAVLKISRVKSSCGCTAAFLAPEDRTIPPGGVSTLPVTMKPTRSKHGERFVKSISVHSNDPIQPVLPIQIECQVKVGVFPDPYSLVFKKLKHGEVRTREVKLTSYTDEAFEVTSVDPIPGPVVVEFDKGRSAREHTLKVSVGPMPDSNNMHSRIRVRTSHSKTARVEILLLVEVEKLITLVPTYLNLGKQDPGSVVEKTITLSPKGDRVVDSVEVKVARYPMEVTARPVEGRLGEWVLSFKVPEDMAGRKIISPLLITTNIAEAGPLRITMSMTVNAKPAESGGAKEDES